RVILNMVTTVRRRCRKLSFVLTVGVAAGLVLWTAPAAHAAETVETSPNCGAALRLAIGDGRHGVAIQVPPEVNYLESVRLFVRNGSGATVANTFRVSIHEWEGAG